MPGSIPDYAPILSLLSPARLATIERIFNIHSPIEIYGFTIWLQNAAASLYPLLQQLELILRNSIDKAAKERFGEYWWSTIHYDATKDNHTKFIKGIRNAELTLRKRWQHKEAARLGSDRPSPVTSSPLTFGHDDIIAATTFSTWEAVMLEALHTDLNTDKHLYLWPLSLTKAFRRLSVIDHRPTEARRKVLNLLKEIRDYRNRLFHHDCIWIKSKSVDMQTAIESIREKINLIEKLIISISPATYKALDAWGLFSSARRVCSVEELRMYTHLDYPGVCEADAAVLDKLLQQTGYGKFSVPLMLKKQAYIFYQLR